jgi:hypothetical protein
VSFIRPLLEPARETNPRAPRLGVLASLGISAAALLAAPAWMPPGYSWISHTTSQSAAQALEFAWIARLGFVALGLAVIGLVSLERGTWSRLAVWLHSIFGVCMIATAAFSHRPWIDGVPFDATEDFLHSIAASAVGFAFAFGVVACTLEHASRSRSVRAVDVVAVIASVVLPLLMAAQPQIAGLLQRAMFGVAYLWYAREAWTDARVVCRRARQCSSAEPPDALSSDRCPSAT